MAAGKTRTSWTKETAPKGKGATKHIKTRVMEKIGLTGWEKLCEFLQNEGAEKLIESMLQLKPQHYVVAYDKLSEFIKPKLSRQTIVGEKDSPVNIEIVKNYADQPNPKTDTGL